MTARPRRCIILNGMFEIKDLQQLVAIADSGTISRAAEKLFISQPALSRAMQKLEDELGVELFIRTKNKVELNENGLFFVGLARGILSSCEEGMRRVRELDRARNTLTIGACAPAPLWEAVRALGSSLPDCRISTEIAPVPDLLHGLDNGTYKLVIVNSPVTGGDRLCRFICRERLLLCLPAEHRLAKREHLTFADIDGITMLLYDGIGVWHFVRQKLPHTRFIVQSGFDDFSDLVRQSSLPSFATDITLESDGLSGRVVVPVVDEGAEQNFYAVTPAKNGGLLARLHTHEKEVKS